jgi:hypothetical protein
MMTVWMPVLIVPSVIAESRDFQGSEVIATICCIDISESTISGRAGINRVAGRGVRVRADHDYLDTGVRRNLPHVRNCNYYHVSSPCRILRRWL